MSKLRKSARNKECTLRICPDGCSNTDTTVLAHICYSWNRGLGHKSPDWFAVYSCSKCHIKLDAERYAVHEIDILRALYETQKIMFDNLLLKVK